MWLVFGLVVLTSFPPLYGEVSRQILKKRNRLTQAVVFFFMTLSVRCDVVERVDAHGLLRGGVGGEHRATRGAIIDVQYSIDGDICAT